MPQDYEEAITRFRKAADQGDARAQFSLSSAYSLGRGVPVDRAEAYFWMNLAVALNTEPKNSFAEFRDDAAAKLSPGELSATQKRCRQWMDAFEKRKAQK